MAITILDYDTAGVSERRFVITVTPSLVFFHDLCLSAFHHGTHRSIIMFVDGNPHGTPFFLSHLSLHYKGKCSEGFIRLAFAGRSRTVGLRSQREGSCACTPGPHGLRPPEHVMIACPGSG